MTIDVSLKLMNSQTINLRQLFKDKHARIQAVVAMLVLAVGFALSVAGFVELQDVASERLYLQTQQHAEAQLRQIQTNLDISLDSLTEIGSFYHVAGDVSRSQLASYIASDTKYHSGTVALGWVPKVAGKDIVKFEQQVRREEPDFYIYEVTGHGMPVPVNKDKASYPTKSIISTENETMKAGLNLASIASRLRVMDKAERIQSTAITQRILIYSGSHSLYGFQAMHPVFEKNELDQSQVVGFVLGVYDIKALIEDVFDNEKVLADVVLYNANTSSQQLLYSSTELFSTVDEVKQQSRPHWTYPLNVADQQWLMVVFPNTAILSAEQSWLPYSGLIAGGLMTLLLTLYLFISLIKTRQLAQLSTDFEGTTTQLDIQTQLKQEADKANQAKSGLLRAASHDLRQPLHTLGLLTTLLKGSKNKAERTQLIDNILAAVDGMNAMFISLLDISLLESNQLPIHKQHFYLQDILDKLTVDFTLQAKEKELSFASVETSTCVMTDPILLGRILVNLLSNAFRYTPNGKILLGCRRLENYIRICVLDTGIGLSDEAKGRVFDAFYRDDSAQKLTDKGLGLGLSIVQEAANLLELKIGMQSQLGKGSVFYVDVPYGDPALIGEVQTIKQQSPINKLIWIIEDDQAIHFGLEKILQSWQCRTKSLASGQETQQLLDQHSDMPDVIIADYQLINETGLEIAIQIQEHYQHKIPVIMMTGTTDLKIRQTIEQAGCQFMMKPVKPEELNSVLHQICP